MWFVVVFVGLVLVIVSSELNSSSNVKYSSVVTGLHRVINRYDMYSTHITHLIIISIFDE